MWDINKCLFIYIFLRGASKDIAPTSQRAYFEKEQHLVVIFLGMKLLFHLQRDREASLNQKVTDVSFQTIISKRCRFYLLYFPLASSSRVQVTSCAHTARGSHLLFFLFNQDREREREREEKRFFTRMTRNNIEIKRKAIME